MSETDRIRVPTNGHRPQLEAVGDDAAPASGTGSGQADDPLGETGLDPRINVTPGQVVAGFGVLAGLLLVLAGVLRRGRGRQG